MSPKRIFQIVFVFVLVILIGGEIYFLYNFSQKQKEQEIKPSPTTPTEQLETTSSPSPTKVFDEELESLVEQAPYNPQEAFEGFRRVKPEEGIYGVIGIVSDISADGFEVMAKGEKMQFLVTDKTSFQSRPFEIEPGNVDLKPLEFEDLKMDDTLDTLFKRNEESQLEAYSVHVIRD